jgi:mono/diheme cytochrome c family protein
MIKFVRLFPAFLQITLIAILTAWNTASGQAAKKQMFPIPENINNIFQTSCMPCHGIKGGRLPKGKLNFSRWAAYGATKEAEKASLICSVLRKGAMPPKKARDSHPELIPSKEQIDLICGWAETLNPEKRKK